MTREDDIWTIEELLWTGGTDAFRNRLAPACLMAFPAIGALEGEEILDSLKDAPRWQSVEMTGRHRVETDGLAVLCYHAKGQREGDAPYEAICTSTWVNGSGGWRLVQHQQSPIPQS
ncbi:nuclear transport factor 2 family protein [Pseudooceanicola sp.]|uniref:nuclear transport factor 2 family protein n=1 Tax=Pseudooceanicola sp. TaxID=1914328 RepID=UPI00405836B9